jgi:hypothetical protein
VSIYGTEYIFHLEDEDDNKVEIFVQVVPAWVNHAGPEWAFLPPARAARDVPAHEDQGYRDPRAVVFTAPWTTKGTPRNGQEYVDPLLVLTGEEWQTMPFRDVMSKLADAIAAHKP